jgi:DNA-binding transcriptional regulator YiaG
VTPRCHHPMRRCERDIPVLEDPVCGRRLDHPGQHLSEAVMEKRRYARRAPSGSPAIGAAILEARRRAGLSRYRLAAVLGVTEQAVGLWEYAGRTPGPESWVQLELALGPLGVVREAARPAVAGNDSSEETADAA